MDHWLCVGSVRVWDSALIFLSLLAVAICCANGVRDAHDFEVDDLMRTLLGSVLPELPIEFVEEDVELGVGCFEHGFVQGEEEFGMFICL